MNRNMILRQFLQRQIPRQNDIPKEKPNISLKQWLNSSKPTNPRFLKQHILNFFISQGLYDIGVQFSKQAGIPMPDIKESQVKARYNVKRLIEQGKVDQGLQQLEKLKLKNKKIKLNEQVINKSVKKQQMNLQKQGIELQQIKSKKQHQQTQKQNNKKEVIEEQLPIEQEIEVPKQDINILSSQKNQQQQPLLSKLVQQELSPNLQNQKEQSQLIQQQEQPKQQNDNKIQKQKQNTNEKKQEHQQIHHIFEEGKNRQLLFTLNCLKVIELIKQNKIQESIKTAREILLPFAKKSSSGEQNQTLDEEQMEKIQKVMSLIAFSNFEDSPNYALTTVQFRAKVAHELNIYLLNESSTEAITALIRLTKWCQKRLKKHVDFPQLNLSSATLYD